MNRMVLAVLFWFTLFINSEAALSVTNSSPTSISRTQAVLQVFVASTNTGDCYLRVYWGRTAGGTNSSAWSTNYYFGAASTGLYSTIISNLSPNSRYYFRALASDSVSRIWAPSTRSFYTLSGTTNAPYNGSVGMVARMDTGEIVSPTSAAGWVRGVAEQAASETTEDAEARQGVKDVGVQATQAHVRAFSCLSTNGGDMAPSARLEAWSIGTWVGGGPNYDPYDLNIGGSLSGNGSPNAGMTLYSSSGKGSVLIYAGHGFSYSGDINLTCDRNNSAVFHINGASQSAIFSNLVIYGNAAGLTNIPASRLVGNIDGASITNLSGAYLSISAAQAGYYRYASTYPTGATSFGQAYQIAFTNKTSTSIWVAVYSPISGKWYETSFNEVVPK